MLSKCISCRGLAPSPFGRGGVGEPFRKLKPLMEAVTRGSQEHRRLRGVARSAWTQAMPVVLQACWCCCGLMPSLVEKHMGLSQEVALVFETVPSLSCLQLLAQRFP